MNECFHTELSSLEETRCQFNGSSRALMKLGIDVHQDYYVVVKQEDGTNPKPTRGRVSPQQPRSFYRPGSRVAVPTPNPVAPAPTIWLVQIFCAPGPTYMLKLGPLVIEIVPVQSAATV
jgi:hypothetical protein